MPSRDGGMPIRQLDVIYSGLAINCIISLPLRLQTILQFRAVRINALLKRAAKYRFTDNVFDMVTAG